MSIHLIQAGGTIDKGYFPNNTNHGYNFEIGTPAFKRILKRAGFSEFEACYSVACQKDSLDITDADRETIYDRVVNEPSNLVIITHGTDTAHLTAERLESNCPGKTIVITGAMQPEQLRDSDADFNLGMAVGAIPWLRAGVYIALNGKVMHWSEYQP